MNLYIREGRQTLTQEVSKTRRLRRRDSRVGVELASNPKDDREQGCLHRGGPVDETIQPRDRCVDGGVENPMIKRDTGVKSLLRSFSTTESP